MNTHAFVDVMLLGNISACLAVTSWGLSPEVWCIMGDCVRDALHHPQSPLPRQLQPGFVSAAHLGKVSQQRGRREMCRWCRLRLSCSRRFFSYKISSHFRNWCDVHFAVHTRSVHFSDLSSPARSHPWPLFCRWASLCSCESVELNLLLRTHYCELDFTGCR